MRQLESDALHEGDEAVGVGEAGGHLGNLELPAVRAVNMDSVSKRAHAPLDQDSPALLDHADPVLAH